MVYTHSPAALTSSNLQEQSSWIHACACAPCRWDDLKKPEFRSINPDGCVPVLQDGDVKMLESGAMTQWLVEKYGNGQLTVPYGTKEHAMYCQVSKGRLYLTCPACLCLIQGLITGWP